MTLPAPRALDLSSFDDVPLFMRDLPASEAEKPSNTTLDALQTLLYDGTPDEIAQNLKSQGNEYYNGRRYKEALGFYTQAIDETGKEIAPQVKRALLSNRSACHLELANYRKCLTDCAALLALPSESGDNDGLTCKALYRSASALFALDKLEEASDAISRLLKTSSAAPDKATEQLASKIDEAISVQRGKAKTAAERERREREALSALRQAITSRGVYLPRQWPPNDASVMPTGSELPHFDPDEPATSNLIELNPVGSRASSLIWSVWLMRPLGDQATRDLVLNWHEDTPIETQLAAVYEGANLDLAVHQFCVVTRQGSIVKLGKKVSLRQMMRAVSQKDDAAVLVDGRALEIFMLDRTAAGDAYIERVKSNASR